MTKEMFTQDSDGQWQLHDRAIAEGDAVELQLADGSWLPCLFSFQDGESEEPHLRVALKGDEDLGAFVDICLSENAANLRWPDTEAAA